MVLIFTKLQTDKQDVIGVAGFKTLSNKKKISEKFCYLSFNITNIFKHYQIKKNIRKFLLIVI